MNNNGCFYGGKQINQSIEDGTILYNEFITLIDDLEQLVSLLLFMDLIKIQLITLNIYTWTTNQPVNSARSGFLVVCKISDRIGRFNFFLQRLSPIESLHCSTARFC